VGAVPPTGNLTLAPPAPLASRPPPVEHVLPPSNEPDLDAEHDEDAPLQFRRIDNVLGPAVVPGLADRVLLEELHTVSAKESAALEEAAQDRSWLTSMVDELRSIEKNKTWEVCQLPPGHRPIGLSSGSSRPRRTNTGLSSSTRPDSSRKAACRGRGSISMKFSLLSREWNRFA
jgi:hypothetical protein